MRKSTALLLLTALTGACDTAYSVAGSDAGSGDAQPAATADAAAATVDGESASVDASGTDASTTDAAQEDAGGMTGFPVPLGPRLRLWLDATDKTTVTMSSANAVASWTDKSSNHLVAVAAAQGAVTYVVDADAGGLHAVGLASDAYLTIADAPALDFTNESFSIYVVARYVAADMSNAFNDLVAKTNLGTTGYELTFPSGGTQIAAYFGSGPNVESSAVEGFGVFTLTVTAGVDGGQGQLAVVELGQISTFTHADQIADNAPLYIGRGVGAASYTFHGSIFEIIIVDQPSSAETTKIAAYLAGKYGRL